MKIEQVKSVIWFILKEKPTNDHRTEELSMRPFTLIRLLNTRTTRKFPNLLPTTRVE